MKAQKTSVTQTGTLVGSRVRFTLDAESLAHLQDLLSVRLYSDRERAVVRELATNGYDTQLAAGYDGPVEVFLPTVTNPTFSVKDHGVGMSRDELETLYTKYGASSKRDDEVQVGMLGLGSKAPLALGDSFTISSVKDHMRTTAVVTRDESGVGGIVVVEHAPTDDPSGTVVSVPTQDTETFRDRAEMVFKFWEPGTVVVDGESPHFVSGLDLGDGMMISTEVAEDYVVMGNVAYPVKIPEDALRNAHVPVMYRETGSFTGRLRKNYGIVVRVPLGTVDFTPSREALLYTDTTSDFVVKVRKVLFPQALRRAAVRMVNEAETRPEALLALKKWKREPYATELPPEQTPSAWRGEPFPSSFGCGGKLWSGVQQATSGWDTEISDYKTVNPVSPAILTPTLLIVSGAWQTPAGNPKVPSPTVREKTLLWLEREGLRGEVTDVLFTASPFAHKEWVKENLCVSAHVIMDIPVKRKKSRSQTTTRALSSEWEIVDRVVGYSAYYQKKPTSSFQKTVVYSSRSEIRQSIVDAYEFFQEVNNIPPSQFTFVVANTNRHGKLVREVPHAVHWDTWIANTVRSYEKYTFTYPERVYSHLSYQHRKLASVLDPAHISDPELAKWITVAKHLVTTSATPDMLTFFSTLTNFAPHHLRTKIPSPQPVYDADDHYPLLNSLTLPYTMTAVKKTAPPDPTSYDPTMDSDTKLLSQVYFYLNTWYDRWVAHHPHSHKVHDPGGGGTVDRSTASA